jgi:hypothetical protein
MVHGHAYSNGIGFSTRMYKELESWALGYK